MSAPAAGDAPGESLVADRAPVVGRYRTIPLLLERAPPDERPHPAEPDTLESLGYPGTLVENWNEIAIRRLGELVAGSRALRVFMDTCTRCGACTDKCHYYLGTTDPDNMPVARQELLRSVWRRHFTFAGRHFPWLVGARDLDEAMLRRWYRYFHQCSECRRCAVFCPKGIDTSEVTMAGREVLASIGIGGSYTRTIASKVISTGNNLGMKRPALADTLESLEEDIAEETGVPVRLPLDEPGAEVLVVTPSADFFAEPHVDGLIGYAKVLHAAGVSWTFSSHASEAANFGLFDGDRERTRLMAERIASAARELGTRRLVIGECGHAWRVAHSYLESLVGPLAEPDGFLDPAHPRAEHVCELTWNLLRAGRIRLDPSRNAGVVATYHDSCNVARGAELGDVPGGQYRIPRELLRAAVPRLVEMSSDTTGQRTFCCGGGGGLLTDELLGVRTAGALPRAQALAAVVESDGVTHMAAICAICKTQFGQVLPVHGLGGVRIASLHQLVGDALVLEPDEAEEGR